MIATWPRFSRFPQLSLVTGGLVMALAGGMLLGLLEPVHIDPPFGIAATAALVAVLYALAEFSMFHLEVRGQALSVTLSDLPLVLGLFLLPPEWLLLARLAPAVLLFLWQRATMGKASFNLGLFVFEIAVATAILAALAPMRTPEVVAWVATYLAILVIDVIGAAAVMGAMRVLGSSLGRAAVAQMISAVVVSGVLSTTLALMAVVVIESSSAGLGLLAALALIVAVAHRAYYRLLRQHTNLNRIFAFTQRAGAQQESEAVIADLLTQAKDLLDAESAELRLRPGSGEPATDPIAAAEPLVIGRSSKDPLLRQWLERAGLRDALLVPLRDDDEVVAVLQVGNRRGAAGTFTSDDLRLLQTLVAHAEVLWHNGQLLEQLRHDAMHDNLTDLANRSLFLQELEALIAHGGSGAVLLLDLDRFKEVNDALGHPVGDRLLEQIANRLRTHVPADSLVARLGGDEFAVLLRDSRSPEEAQATARAARAALTGAFEVQETFLEVGASVGVAMVPEDGQDAATVLRRADMAMYEAKRTSAGVVRYEPSQDRRSTDLLSLAGEMRQAIEAEQILMHFQPKANLKTGRVVGFEALARWHHPVRGLVMPDTFVPLAEQTGLVDVLSQSAIAQSLTACRRWLADTPGVGVAVNLSPRWLLEPTLASAVAQLLERTGVPADRLTLEITENSIMGDLAASVRALQQLRELGVRLAVDDFGTGYSSLGYLHRLPVHEVKIDKSFIMPMPRDTGATSIVKMIIDLSHTLGLTVVAEGVEVDETREALAEVGCDVLQGYVLGRPMPPGDVQPWLLAHRETTRRERITRPRAV